ncbi:MAG TPA: DUF1003 domain-containing protein [Allosphingosinicella sp.]|jgi:uncharacterized membrane protein
MANDPTVAPPQPESLNSALHRNIAALERRRRVEARSAPRNERVAQAISDFAGTMTFIYLHLAIVGAWIAVNVGWLPFIPAFDESLVILAMAASVEAIFISTFVLISQNRMAAAAEKRAELDLQISLLAEHEITKVVAMVDAIADHLGIRHEAKHEVDELKRDVAPENVLDAISDCEQEEAAKDAGRAEA